MFSLKDKPGALYLILRPFARHRINLTKIESRPSKRKAWEYMFFVDMEGHIEDKGGIVNKSANVEFRTRNVEVRSLNKYSIFIIPCS
jgi:chorismate mutase/prephenate dehydratase